MIAPANFPGALPPMPAVARILAKFDRDKLGAAIEVMIALLDASDAPDDPDAPDFRPCSDGQPGDPGDGEPNADETDVAWLEWNGRERESIPPPVIRSALGWHRRM